MPGGRGMPGARPGIKPGGNMPAGKGLNPGRGCPCCPGCPGWGWPWGGGLGADDGVDVDDVVADVVAAVGAAVGAEVEAGVVAVAAVDVAGVEVVAALVLGSPSSVPLTEIEPTTRNNKQHSFITYNAADIVTI